MIITNVCEKCKKEVKGGDTLYGYYLCDECSEYYKGQKYERFCKLGKELYNILHTHIIKKHLIGIY